MRNCAACREPQVRRETGTSCWRGRFHDVARRFPGRGTRSLLAAAQANRARARARCLAVLSRPQVTAALAQLDQAGESATARPPLRRFARKVLQQQHDKVRKQQRRLATLDTGEVHRLRIRVKRLRYTAEFFGGVFPAKATRAYVSVLRDLQDQLGAMQDATTFAKLASSRAFTRADPRARALLQGWCAAQAARQRDLAKGLERQPRFRPFWG